MCVTFPHRLMVDPLDRTRIEAGQLALPFHTFSPAELAEDAQSTLAWAGP
jgi:hypothetical protein